MTAIEDKDVSGSPGWRQRRKSGGDARGRSNDTVVRVCQILLLPLTIGFWHFVAISKFFDPLVARTPGQVLTAVTKIARSGELALHLRSTMEAVFVAFALASVVGIFLGILLALMPRTERVLSPYFDAFNAMPRIALAPVFLIYFGIGTSAKVALAFSLVVFIVMANARAGVLSADADVLRLTTILGARKHQIFTKVYLPVATPAIFAGLRLGLIYSLLGVVASELIAARDGLGMLVAQYSGVFEMEGVYGVLIILALVASVLNSLMRLIERYVLRWQPPEAAQ